MKKIIAKAKEIKSKATDKAFGAFLRMPLAEVLIIVSIFLIVTSVSYYRTQMNMFNPSENPLVAAKVDPEVIKATGEYVAIMVKVRMTYMAMYVSGVAVLITTSLYSIHARGNYQQWIHGTNYRPMK